MMNDEEYEALIVKGRREPGTVRSVDIGLHEHYGVLTSMIFVDLDGGGVQGFGGWRLTADIAEDFVRTVTATFGKESQKLDVLVGESVFALRSFGTYNDTIVGLESVATGRRFVMHDWVKKHFPDTKAPLEQERESILSRYNSAMRNVETARSDLATLDARHHDWRST